MQFNVSQLLKSAPGDERTYDFRDADDEIEKSIAPVQGHVRLIRSDKGITVFGAVRTAVGCQCSRCLVEFSLPVEFQLEEEFFLSTDVASGLPMEVPSDQSLVIDNRHMLDLGETVQQYASFHVPMKPLCREGCEGLCSVCGQDLNDARCNCASREIDPRWSKLAELSALKTLRA